MPAKETILYEASDYTSEFIDLSIPSGVKVVKVYCFVEIIEQDDSFSAEASVKSYINGKFNKLWGVAEIYGNGTDEITKHVGVTPGKTYRLSVLCTTALGSAYLSISYSSTINAHAVDVEDY